MIRFLATLLLGAAFGIAVERMFPQFLPHTPAALQNAAASIGIKENPSAAAANYALSGPLSSSIKAETSKKYDDALKEVFAFQQAGGDPFVASLRAGWLYYLKGAYPEAEQAYANANRLHTGALNPVLGLLNVAEATKDGMKIQRMAEAVLRIDPSNYRASMLLGSHCYAVKDYHGSAFAYRRILNLYPDDVDARSGLAWAAYYTGDSHDAFAQFQTILNIYPDYPFAKQGYKLVAGVNGGGALAR